MTSTVTRKNINHVRKTHRNNLFVIGVTQFAAWSFILSPVFFKDLSKSLKGCYFALGLFASISQVVMANHSKKTAALAREYSKYEMQGVANALTTAKNLDAKIDGIAAQESLVEIVEGLPAYKRQRYEAEFKLFGLLQPTQQSGPNQTQSAAVSNTIQVKKHLPVFDSKTEKLLDTSWMNHQFFFKSTIVVGDEGTGKTNLLAFMAANIIAICPQVDLRIHNLHYDPEEPWFPGMPRDVEESLFITTPQECLEDLLNVKAELRRRELEKDRTSPPIIRISDEFQGLADELGPEDWKEYVNAIIQIKNRGRKYAFKINGQDTGCRMLLGCHSMKTKMTGLDSSFFAGANVICLGQTILDSNTPFPQDFDIKQLAKDLQMCKATLLQMGLMNKENEKLDRARPAVMRLGNGAPGVKVMPKPDLSTINYAVAPDPESEESTEETVTQSSVPKKMSAADFSGATYIDKLLGWYRAGKGQANINELHEQLGILLERDVEFDESVLNNLKDLLDKKMRGINE
jgi:hypothetical protein